MLSINDESKPENTPTQEGAEIEQTDDFKYFQQNLSVKKPMLLPLELQIQLKREREKQETAAA